MTPVHFLTIEDVIEIHASMIEQHGGSLELLSRELFQSAIAMPQAGMGDQYFHPDLPSMAAAYLSTSAKITPSPTAISASPPNPPTSSS